MVIRKICDTMRNLNLVVIFTLIVPDLGSRVHCQDDITWGQELSLGRGVLVKWTRDDPEWMIMEMSAPTTGYVAVGFSPNAGMTGSDIVVGWVDGEGRGHIQDMYATKNGRPILDPIQNYELLNARQAENRTTIRFRRKWNTCDKEHDNIIGEDTEHIIWAYHPDDPIEIRRKFPVQYRPTYHGEIRGIKKSFIRIPGNHAAFPDPAKNPQIKYWDIRMKGNLVNGESDVFYCTIFKLPVLRQKHHLIGFKPLLDEGITWNVHHMFLFECIVPQSEGGTQKIFDQYVSQPGGRCYTPSMPTEWGQFCVNMPIIWTSGSEGTIFPSQMGFPLGEEHGGATYFMFEIHYDNPQRKTFTDSSGLRLIYTDKLREFDGGIFTAGHKISPFETVPHSMSSFTAKGFCSSECTAQVIPSTGITAVGVLLHAHYSGRKLELKHLRNGKELPSLAKETKYDFYYQQTRALEPGRQILPGDELISVCEYDTRSRESPAFGGVTTKDEMCLHFIYYYPKIPLTDCKSQPEFYSFLSGLGIRSKVSGDILKELKMPYIPKEGQSKEYPDNPFVLKNSTADNYLNAFDVLNIDDANCSVGDYIKSINWVKKGKEVQDKWLNGKHYAFCTGPNQRRYPLKNYILSMPKYEPAVIVDPCLN